LSNPPNIVRQFSDSSIRQFYPTVLSDKRFDKRFDSPTIPCCPVAFNRSEPFNTRTRRRSFSWATRIRSSRNDFAPDLVPVNARPCRTYITRSPMRFNDSEQAPRIEPSRVQGKIQMSNPLLRVFVHHLFTIEAPASSREATAHHPTIDKLTSLGGYFTAIPITSPIINRINT